MEIGRAKSTALWIAGYAAILFAIGNAAIFVIQLSDTDEKSPWLTLAIAISALLLFLLIKRLWARSTLQRGDLEQAASITAGHLGNAGRFQVVSFDCFKVTFFWDVGNFLRYEIFWMPPKRHPLWRKLDNARRANMQGITKDELRGLAIATSAVVVSSNSDKLSVAEANDLIERLKARYKQKEIELWQKKSNDNSEDAKFCKINASNRAKVADQSSFVILIFLAPWEKRKLLQVLSTVSTR